MNEDKNQIPVPLAIRQPLAEAVIVRARSEDLEDVLMNMPRIADATKVRLREYFVDGLSMHEIADRHGCAVSQVHNAVRHTRVALAARMSPWNYVSATITVPILLAQELQTMSDQLAQLKDRNRADECLGTLIYAIADVQKKLPFLANDD
jgi:predicted DNA-binding protein YlxM (UPF0122 family)